MKVDAGYVLHYGSLTWKKEKKSYLEKLKFYYLILCKQEPNCMKTMHFYKLEQAENSYINMINLWTNYAICVDLGQHWFR